MEKDANKRGRKGSNLLNVNKANKDKTTHSMKR